MHYAPNNLFISVTWVHLDVSTEANLHRQLRYLKSRELDVLIPTRHFTPRLFSTRSPSKFMQEPLSIIKHQFNWYEIRLMIQFIPLRCSGQNCLSLGAMTYVSQASSGKYILTITCSITKFRKYFFLFSYFNLFFLFWGVMLLLLFGWFLRNHTDRTKTIIGGSSLRISSQFIILLVIQNQ